MYVARHRYIRNALHRYLLRHRRRRSLDSARHGVTSSAPAEAQPAGGCRAWLDVFLLSAGRVSGTTYAPARVHCGGGGFSV